MISIEDAITKFKEILGGSTSWKSIINSQFVNHLAIFQSWALRDALWKVERAVQEFFLGTALNRSSIVAHAEDREYLPRKPKPSTGKVSIRNMGDSPVTIIKGREFLSDLQLTYTADATTIIAAGQTVEIAVTQVKPTVITHTVTETKAFYEVLLGHELSPKVASFTVMVDTGEGSELWTYSRLLHNAYATSKFYDEFYAHTDEIGIRFGNGTFGVIPPTGSTVTITVQETEGDSLLLQKQTLYPIDDLPDSLGQPANITITVSSAIDGGEAAEGTEETRRNLHYWPVYNEKLVWSDDYTYFLRRRFPEIVFCSAWGEEEAEKMAGAPSLDFINRIYISAYAPRTGLKDDCMAALAEVPLLCRKFTWVDPVHVTFSLAITGKVLTDRALVDVETDVRNALNAAYGKDSLTRRKDVYLSEIYEVIYSTGHFEKTTGARFEALPSGIVTAEYLYQMVSIDLSATTVSLNYL